MTTQTTVATIPATSIARARPASWSRSSSQASRPPIQPIRIGSSHHAGCVGRPRTGRAPAEGDVTVAVAAIGDGIGAVPSPTSVCIGSSVTYRRHAACHPSRVRGNRSTGAPERARSQIPKYPSPYPNRKRPPECVYCSASSAPSGRGGGGEGRSAITSAYPCSEEGPTGSAGPSMTRWSRQLILPPCESAGGAIGVVSGALYIMYAP
jgi:hypothetical protein